MVCTCSCGRGIVDLLRRSTQGDQEAKLRHAASSCPTPSTDSTMLSDEFSEYEREFRKYMAENLRSHIPSQDFISIIRDSRADLSNKLNCLVDWWRCSQRVVVFTGAGVSTAAGLPDYRGPQGVWTQKLCGESVSETFDFTKGSILPTSTHLILARMYEKGQLHHVVTTNVDALHLDAGLSHDGLSELHGNSFVEECELCQHRFQRSFHTRTSTSLFEHRTGRFCEDCGGPLRDNIVNFGNTVEHVPSMEAEHDRAWVECLKADLVVVLGSSLSVPTACDLPEECLEPRDGKPDGGKLVIVNLQRTPKDGQASLRLYAACDEVIAHLERALL